MTHIKRQKLINLFSAVLCVSWTMSVTRWYKLAVIRHFCRQCPRVPSGRANALARLLLLALDDSMVRWLIPAMWKKISRNFEIISQNFETISQNFEIAISKFWLIISKFRDKFFHMSRISHRTMAWTHHARLQKISLPTNRCDSVSKKISKSIYARRIKSNKSR